MGQKHAKILPDFGRLQSSAANIFGTNKDIQNQKVLLYIAIPPALGETSPVNFGQVILKIYMWNRTRPKRIFQKNIFRH